MNEPIDGLISYADHTQGCMVAAGHDECTCGYDDAHAKMWAAWDALKAENARLAAALREIKTQVGLYYHPPSILGDICDIADAALSAVPSDSPADVKSEAHRATVDAYRIEQLTDVLRDFVRLCPRPGRGEFGESDDSLAGLAWKAACAVHDRATRLLAEIDREVRKNK